MATESKRIAIVLYQYSVVVKGIEKKLEEAGYQIEIIENFGLIKAHALQTDLFVVYLPGEILEDAVKLENFKKICTAIEGVNGKMLIIGEKKIHEELLSIVPAIRTCPWIDRPVDMEVLCPAIDKAIASEQAPAPAEPAAPAAAATAASDKKSILIVDDDPSYASMVREWIKDEYQVDIVTTGGQAVKFLFRKKVSLILLDYEMPVVDGPQVLSMFRQDPKMSKIPVVFLTGVGTKEAVQRVMSLQPDGYILKSTTREDLLKFLKEKIG